MPSFDTALNVLDEASRQLGLGAQSAPFASTDANIVQLVALLKSAGRKLVKAHQWSQLVKTHTLSTVDGTASYALPADFDRLTLQTMWDRTAQMPVPPVSAQGWHFLQAQTSMGSVWTQGRIYGNLLYLHPTPSSVSTVAYEYVSSFWVMPSGQTSPTATTTTASTDTLWFDRELLIDALKLEWKGAKGMDPSMVLAGYATLLAGERSADSQAGIINMAGEHGVKLIGLENVPDTGYGS